MAMIAAEALSLRLRGPRRRPLLLHHPALPMHLPESIRMADCWQAP